MSKQGKIYKFTHILKTKPQVQITENVDINSKNKLLQQHLEEDYYLNLSRLSVLSEFIPSSCTPILFLYFLTRLVYLSLIQVVCRSSIPKFLCFCLKVLGQFIHFSIFSTYIYIQVYLNFRTYIHTYEFQNTYMCVCAKISENIYRYM